MNQQNTSMAQVLATLEAQQAQINVMIDMMSKITGQEAKTVNSDPKTVEISESTSEACVHVTKAGKACKVKAQAGTDTCHIHAGNTRKPSPNKAQLADNTLTVKIGQTDKVAHVDDLHKAMLKGACVMDYAGAYAKNIRSGLTGKGWKFTWTSTNTFTAAHPDAAHTLTGIFGKRTRKNPTAKREFVIA